MTPLPGIAVSSVVLSVLRHLIEQGLCYTLRANTITVPPRVTQELNHSLRQINDKCRTQTRAKGCVRKGLITAALGCKACECSRYNMRLPQTDWSCLRVTLGRANWLKNPNISYLVFLKGKMAKNRDWCTEERSKSGHMLACDLGVRFPALMKAVSPHHEGSKVNRFLPRAVMRGHCTKQGTRNVL